MIHSSKGSLPERGKLNTILNRVLDRIRPTTEERKKIKLITDRILSEIKRVAEDNNVPCTPELVGSVAKDTWLSGDRDIDVFILFDPTLSIETMKTMGIFIAKEVVIRLGGRIFERYAQHPYVEAIVDGYRVDIVPAFKVNSVESMKTPVDRTPFHTRYVNSRLDSKMKDEVRLLKQFLKGIGVYGAEVKIGGFSGYLAELLIIYYGDFIKVLNSARRWRPFNTFICIERELDVKSLRKLFSTHPLVVLDPVDPRRNAAAALTLDRLSEFIAASKVFLNNPSEDFFFPKKPTYSKDDLLNAIVTRKSSLIAIHLKCRFTSPDILWSQVYRSLGGLETLLKIHGFRVISKRAWSDEIENIVFLYELLTLKLPIVERHVGPPVSSEREDEFLRKYIGSNITISGPFIENGRWIVYRKRRYTDAVNLMRCEYDKVRHGTQILKCLKEGFKIYVNEEILELADLLGADFTNTLCNWLRGRVYWLKAIAKNS